MSELTGAMQNRIAPPVSQYNSVDFSSAETDNQTESKIGTDKRTDFRDLISNSMEDVNKEREAKKLGDLSSGTEAEFFEKLAEQTKQKREIKKEMDKDDFLKLFVSQLQNQDPLNPDDGTEMASKLAQFNGLEQMMNMNKTMEKMVNAQNVGRNLQMVNYVGKEISVDGGRLRLKDGKASNSAFDVTVPATRSTLTIRDTTGMVVSERELGPLDLGEHPFVWDGKNDAGNSVSDGMYQFSIYARDIEGNQIPIPIKSKTIISGVNVQSEGGDLFTELGPVKFDEVLSVGNPGYDQKSAALLAKAQLLDPNATAAFQARKTAKAEARQAEIDAQKPPAAEASASPEGMPVDANAPLADKGVPAPKQTISAKEKLPGKSSKAPPKVATNADPIEKADEKQL